MDYQAMDMSDSPILGGCRHRSCCRIAAVLLGQHKRVAGSRIMFRRDCGQPRAKAFERVVPQRIARERVKTEDFAAARCKNCPILQEDVDKI